MSATLAPIPPRAAPPPLPATPPQTHAGGRILMHDVPWEAYEALVEANGEGPVRIAYDRGDMEIAMPGGPHDRMCRVLALMIGTYSLIQGIPCIATGSTTWKRRTNRVGLEADESFYIQHHDAAVGRTLDLDVDPPPDLAIEVDVTSGSQPKLTIYVRLGIPEVWRHHRGELTVLVLEGEGYVEARSSRAFPDLSMDLVREALARSERAGEYAAMQWFRQQIEG